MVAYVELLENLCNIFSEADERFRSSTDSWGVLFPSLLANDESVYWLQRLVFDWKSRKKTSREQSTLSMIMPRCWVVMCAFYSCWSSLQSFIYKCWSFLSVQFVFTVNFEYIVALFAFQALTTGKPDYLSDQLQLCAAVRQLCSSDRKNRLNLNSHRTTFASWAFRNAAPVVWNSLPHQLTDDLSYPASFRHNLKHISLANLSVTDCRGNCIRQFIFDWHMLRHQLLNNNNNSRFFVNPNLH